MRRWLRTVTPPSKRSRRCFPIASTPSSVRPSTARATPVACPRGCGEMPRPVADERLEPAGRAVEGVAFGHRCQSLPDSRRAGGGETRASGCSGLPLAQVECVHDPTRSVSCPTIVQLRPQRPPQHRRPRAPHRRRARHAPQVGAALRRVPAGAHGRRPAALQRNGRAARGVAARPDPRRLAHRRGCPRARRGECGRTRRSRPSSATRSSSRSSANDLRGVSATLDQTFAVLPLEQALTDVVTPRFAGPARRGIGASCRWRRSMRSRRRCARIWAGCCPTAVAASTASPSSRARPASAMTSACSCSP